jgi:hypothetical protein
VCDLETSRTGAQYIYDISNLRVKHVLALGKESSVQQTYRVVLNSNTSDLFSESAILESGRRYSLIWFFLDLQRTVYHDILL